MDVRSRETIRILLVDGSRDDVALVREHVRGQRAQLELVHMADGDAARAYLGQKGMYTDASGPDVILVELTAPGVGGPEFLGWLKGNPLLRMTPAIALLRDGDSTTVERCYDLGANCVLWRPAEPDEIVSLAQLIEEFWFCAVQLPRRVP